MPYFTVVTICFNDLENLKRTAQSVRTQTCQDFDWIVVDGASQDGTPEWLAEQDHPNLTWVSERDRGLYDAMNKGISRASGQYLIFMNSGDCFAAPDVLENAKTAIQSAGREVLLAYGDSADTEADGTVHARLARSHATSHTGMFAQHQAMFFRAGQGIRYRDEYRLSADYAFIGEYLRLAAQDCSDYRLVLKLNFTVCSFLLGGLNEQRRYAAIKEDYLIRRNIYGLGRLTCSLLYIAHCTHTWVKQLSPRLGRMLRRKVRVQSVTPHLE